MILFVYGNDTYRSSEYIKSVKEKFKKDVDPSGLNCEEVDLSSISFSQLMSAMKSMPFMAKRRLVVVQGILQNRKFKEHLKELKTFCEADEKGKQEGDNIILFYENSGSLGKTGCARFLKTSVHAKEFEPLQGFALNKWIKQYCRSQGGRIDEEAVKELASLVGNDLWVMSNEINKLIAYKNTDKIEQEDVVTLVSGVFDEDIFSVVDAIGNKRTKVAYELLHEHLSSGVHELYMLTMLIRQYRILLQVQELVLLGKTKKEISLQLKIHPFVVQKAIGQSRNYTKPELVRIYRDLFSIDRRIKTGALGKDATVLFDTLIAKLGLK